MRYGNCWNADRKKRENSTTWKSPYSMKRLCGDFCVSDVSFRYIIKNNYIIFQEYASYYERKYVMIE